MPYTLKSKYFNFFIYAIIIIILLLIVYDIFSPGEITEGLVNIPTLDKPDPKWTQTNTCKYRMNETTFNALSDHNVLRTTQYNDADIFFPCGYNDIDKEIQHLPNVYHNNNGSKRVFIIYGADEITAKNNLWKNMIRHHGLHRAKELSPNTYILVKPYRDEDLIRLDKEHQAGRMYIMKKNIQRQTGLEITDNVDYIKNNNMGYVIVQELLQNPYLVNGRKINLRVYIVVVCHQEFTDVYMFNDGFVYYTKKMFVLGDNSTDNHITTGYVERDIYHKNPLTHIDFKKYLDLEEGMKYHESNPPRKLYSQEKIIRDRGYSVSDIVFKRIEDMLRNVFISFKGSICRHYDVQNKVVPIYYDYSIQIFGADVAINDHLVPQIIEINKGPDLNSKDDRDGNVKRQLVDNTLELLGIKNKSNVNGLIKILEM